MALAQNVVVERDTLDISTIFNQEKQNQITQTTKLTAQLSEEQLWCLSLCLVSFLYLVFVSGKCWTTYTPQIPK
jgi:hypothetical protein